MPNEERSHHKAKILVCDDDFNVRLLTRQCLEAENMVVVEAADGPEAIDVFMRERPDLVFLDVLMPGIDGLEVLRRIRARSAIPVIMLTGRTEEADRVKGLENGADDYVTKPFSPRELIARVRAVLRRARPAPNEQLRLADLEMDLVQHKVRRAGRSIPLGGEIV